MSALQAIRYRLQGAPVQIEPSRQGAEDDQIRLEPNGLGHPPVLTFNARHGDDDPDRSKSSSATRSTATEALHQPGELGFQHRRPLTFLELVVTFLAIDCSEGRRT